MKDKITMQDIEDNILDIEIVKHVTKGGKILRWAVITTENLFAVTGRPSATINAANDNVEVGEKVAIDNAKSEMWALMGYNLSQENYDKFRTITEINEDTGEIRIVKCKCDTVLKEKL